jgi:hypothetical protein
MTRSHLTQGKVKYQMKKFKHINLVLKLYALKATSLKTAVFWSMKLCSLRNVYRCFIAKSWVNHQSRRVNFCRYTLPNYTALFHICSCTCTLSLFSTEGLSESNRSLGLFIVIFIELNVSVPVFCKNGN